MSPPKTRHFLFGCRQGNETAAAAAAVSFGWHDNSCPRITPSVVLLKRVIAIRLSKQSVRDVVRDHGQIQDFGIGEQFERRRREYRGAAGAEGVRFWEGVSPSPMG